MFKRTTVGSGEGGNFLKIEDNSSVNVILGLSGGILEFYQHWPLGGEKQVFDKPTAGASPRFKINALVFEDGKFVAKIWEYPPTVSNMLADIADAGYDLATTKIRISKTRQGKKVSYSVLPLAGPKDKLSAKQLKELSEVELSQLSISPTEAPKELKNYAPSSDDNPEGLPF